MMVVALLKICRDGGRIAGRPVYQALLAADYGVDPRPLVGQIAADGRFVLFAAVTTWAMLAAQAISILVAADPVNEKRPASIMAEVIFPRDEWEDDNAEAQLHAYSAVGAFVDNDPTMLGELWETCSDGQRYACALVLVAALSALLTMVEELEEP